MMTTGERIAQKRKALGLSQEALGEKLGVSRQAIYKWESDASLPDIDKLVQLSRLFQVSIGWLLGEEDATDASTHEPEWSEGQLAQLEQLIRQYAARPADASAERETRTQRQKRWAMAAAICIVVLGLLLWRISGKLNDLQSRYNNLQGMLLQTQQNTQQQIYGITNHVESLLNRLNNFTADHKVEIIDCDYAAGTVTFALQATPKTYTDGMAAVFRAEYTDANGRAAAVEQPAAYTNGAYTAQITCPLVDSLSTSITFLTGDRQDYQPLEAFDGLYGASFPLLYEVFSLWLDIENGKVENCPVILNLVSYHDEYPGMAPPAEIAEVKCGLFGNRKLVQWYTPTTAEAVNWHSEDDSLYYFFDRPEIPLEPGVEYCNAWFVTDIYGRTIVYHGEMCVYTPGEEPSAQVAAMDTKWDALRNPADWEY